MSILSACVLLTIFLVLTTGQIAFEHSTYLDPDNKYLLSWSFNDATITFQVQVETTGYVGLGFSPNGGMKGSDIILGWVDHNGTVKVTDRHADGEREPEEDFQRDVHVLSGHENETHTTLVFSRRLDTCDDEDMKIGTQTVRVIWSYGDSDPDSQTWSAKYHGENRGSKSIYLLNPQNEHPELPTDAIQLDFMNSKVSIPKKDTLYWCKSFAVPKLSKKHHVIQLEPIIDVGHETLVHHVLIYGCFHNVDASLIGVGHECYQPTAPSDWVGCYSVMYAWAIGGGKYSLPEKAGIPISFEGDPTMFLMEMHYDNPGLEEGLFDSSGIRLHATPTLRAFDAGIIEMGAIADWTQMIPGMTKEYITEGHCLPDCTAKALKDQPGGINVISVMLHSHLAGRAIRLRHFRNGREVKMIAADPNYDFNLQEYRILEKEVTILPGDHTITECTYENNEWAWILGGLGSKEEMCLAFVTYYPRISMSICASGPTSEYWHNFRDMKKGGFKNLTELLGSLDWSDKANIDELQRYTTQTGVPGFKSRCLRAGDPLGEIDTQPHSLPPKLTTLAPEPDCSGPLPSGTPKDFTINVSLVIVGLHMLIRYMLSLGSL